MKIKRNIIYPLFFSITYLIYFFFMLKFFYNKQWLIDVYSITKNNIMIALLYDIAMILLPVLLLIFMLRYKKKSIYLSGTTKLGKWFALGLLIIYIGIFIAQGNFSLSGIYPCFFYLIVVAFGEEFIFRGYVFTELNKGVPTYIAIIISGMIFGAMHAFMPAIINNYSIMELFNAILSDLGNKIVISAFFVWLYKKSNSLIIPILVHALIDYYPVLFR